MAKWIVKVEFRAVQTCITEVEADSRDEALTKVQDDPHVEIDNFGWSVTNHEAHEARPA